MTASEVFRIGRDRAAEAGDVLGDAFHDYPTTRFIIGGTGEAYGHGLRALCGFFVAARFLRNEPVLAVADGAALVAVATVTLAGDRPSPPALASLRDRVWRDLGAEALQRYEAFGRACEAFVVEEPHYHLNLVGVIRSHAGRGLARRLLDAVHAMSLEDPSSRGVTLTTEDPRNVPLYRHFGYEIIGRSRVTDTLETWGFFRRDG